jgi:hypothetical protein
MAELHFKTKAYQFYAPHLFKLKRLFAKYLGYIWRLNHKQIQELIDYYWDKYLATKFYQEVPFYPGEKFELKNVNRSSDTIFILGCGASINDLTKNDWAIINQHDSIGVNYFYAHEFRPNFHMIELGQSPLSLDYLNKNLLMNKARSNETVFMQIRHVMRRKSGKLCDENGNLYLYSPSVPKSTSTSLIKRIVVRWYSKPGVLMHHASNLDCTVHFAYQTGYKNIYLLGVDLNSNQYFWDVKKSPSQSELEIKAATIDDYETTNFYKNPNKQHATADKIQTMFNNSLTVVEYLKIIDDNIFKKECVKFATCSPNSLLRDHFDFVELGSLKYDNKDI